MSSMSSRRSYQRRMVCTYDCEWHGNFILIWTNLAIKRWDGRFPYSLSCSVETVCKSSTWTNLQASRDSLEDFSNKLHSRTCSQYPFKFPNHPSRIWILSGRLDQFVKFSLIYFFLAAGVGWNSNPLPLQQRRKRRKRELGIFTPSKHWRRYYSSLEPRRKELSGKNGQLII
jgi:hypothetical protein